MEFRPCIDLKDGAVVQIVGGSLRDDSDQNLHVNHLSPHPSSYFAKIYREDSLSGGHVIALGKGNLDASLEALKAFPGGLQYGGGVTPENAQIFLEAGASHVIVTSYLFENNKLSFSRLRDLINAVGKERLVLDLSCRKRNGKYWVTCNRWQTFTDLEVTSSTLDELSKYCSEFLVHGADVEGMRAGVEDNLITLLGKHSPIPCTYAGGVKSLHDFERVKDLGDNRVHLTIGSALDLFGGDVLYSDVLSWHLKNSNSSKS